MDPNLKIFISYFVLKFHGRPNDLQLLQHSLHGHLLDGFVHDVVDLVLKVVEVERKLVVIAKE